MTTKTKAYNGIEAVNVSSLRGIDYHKLIMDDSLIPPEPGVYIWRYWPVLKDLSKEELVYELQNITDHPPYNLEQLKRVKYSAEIRQTFMSKQDISKVSFLGLSDKKRDLIVDYLNDDLNKNEFISLMNLQFLFLTPLYIGKANDIRDRLTQHHFKRRNSEILNDIEKMKLNLKHISISFICLHGKDAKTVNVLYEEILQWISHPILTRKYG